MVYFENGKKVGEDIASLAKTTKDVSRKDFQIHIVRP